MNEKKMIPRFIIALILALIAGAGNYWYLTKAKYVTVLAYGSPVKKGDEVSSQSLTKVRFSVPDDASKEQFLKTFVEPSKASVLIGAKANGDHSQGELVLTAHFDSGTNLEAADYRVFGDFRVVGVDDSTITIEIEAKNGTLDAPTRRFIEISNVNAKSKGAAQIYGVVEHNTASQDADGIDPSNSLVVGSRERLTVRLPPNCALPASLISDSSQRDEIQKKNVRVGFIVSASMLSSSELRASAKSGSSR